MAKKKATALKIDAAPIGELKENKNNLVLVSNDDDWEALYVNGKKVESHHHVEVETISEWSAKLQMVYIRRSCTAAYTEMMQDGIGDFPDNLSEIDLEKE